MTAIGLERVHLSYEISIYTQEKYIILLEVTKQRVPHSGTHSDASAPWAHSPVAIVPKATS
ncbi:hypothetical protein, partial [Planktothricoides sp. SR001]|uniref:hypothetical protein n=1 Tax=Planktothricoides sp. SR001 TaxID=1705388 RepID=UPI001E5A4F72